MFVLNTAQGSLFIKPIFGGDLNAYYMASYMERTSTDYLHTSKQSMDGPSTYDYFGRKFDMDTFNQTVSIQGVPLFAFTKEIECSNDSGDAMESADHFFNAIKVIEETGFLKWAATQKAKHAKAPESGTAMFSSSTQDLLEDVSDYYLRWVEEMMEDDIAKAQAVKQLGWALQLLEGIQYEETTKKVLTINLPYSHAIKVGQRNGGQGQFNKARVPTTAHALTVDVSEERTLKLIPWCLRYMLGLETVTYTEGEVPQGETF